MRHGADFTQSADEDQSMFGRWLQLTLSAGMARRQQRYWAGLSAERQ